MTINQQVQQRLAYRAMSLRMEAAAIPGPDFHDERKSLVVTLRSVRLFGAAQ